MASYPDIEQLLCDWLIGMLPVGPGEDFRQIQPETPDDLFRPPGMPCVVIERLPSGERVTGLDRPRISVETYCTGPNPHAARAAAIARGEDIRRTFALHLAGAVLGEFWPSVSVFKTVQAPVIRPYDQSGQIRKTQGIYDLGLHFPLTDD